MAEPVNKNEVSDFICTICMSVPLEPRILETCSHIFCDNCIAKGLSKKRRCPNCNESFKKTQVLKLKNNNCFASRIWANISVKCENHKENCGWTGAVTDYESHLKSCVIIENKKLHAEKECLDKATQNLEVAIGLFQQAVGRWKSSKRKFASLKDDAASEEGTAPDGNVETEGNAAPAQENAAPDENAAPPAQDVVALGGNVATEGNVPPAEENAAPPAQDVVAP